MARSYDGPSLKQGKVEKPVKAAASDAKDTAGDPPSPSSVEGAKKDTDSGSDPGPSKAGADNNKAMFGEMAPKHLTERRGMQDRHLKEMTSMHDTHHTEHRDMMKAEGDGEKGGEMRLAMHMRHHQARHTMMGNHAMEHADMAHRHAAEMRGGGNPGEAKGGDAPKLGKEQNSGSEDKKKEVSTKDSPKLGKPKDEGRTEG